ncbi:MAG: hypothetical protein NZM25_02245 [Leptospiraceae bacterium]|nr:hypothetical protein [Leptospiraceae bacterium]MDW8306998.1 hypothetical protein [Leptospiraceae bacterium]
MGHRLGQEKAVGVGIILYWEENSSLPKTRLLHLQLRKTTAIIGKFAGSNIFFYPVILAKSRHGLFLPQLPKGVILRESSPEKALPIFLLRRCQKILILPSQILPNYRDFAYLLNLKEAVALLEPRPGNFWSTLLLPLQDARWGLIGLDIEKLRQLRQRRLPKPKQKSYSRYPLPERLFLTLWFSSGKLFRRKGRSRAFLSLTFFLSWRFFFEFIHLWLKGYPWPSMRIKSLHFRILASQFAIFLGLTISPSSLLWFYILVALALSWDYFFFESHIRKKFWQMTFFRLLFFFLA